MIKKQLNVIHKVAATFFFSRRRRRPHRLCRSVYSSNGNVLAEIRFFAATAAATCCCATANFYHHDFIHSFV